MIKRLKFVSIPVADQQRAKAFYRDVMGFKIMTEQHFSPTQSWIEMAIPGAETRIVLFTPEGHEDRVGGFMNLSLECDDVAATYKQLSGRGAQFEGPVQAQPWGTFAKLRDSEGNQLLLSSG